MTRVLGVDPGAVSGGLAIVEINDSAAPQLLDAIDLPVVGVKAKQRIDVLALRNWIQQHRPDHAYIERGQAHPHQGASSGFKYGICSVEEVSRIARQRQRGGEAKMHAAVSDCARSARAP
jgi:Holliday junction resolvasome RuvABC endonuclease subunit